VDKAAKTQKSHLRPAASSNSDEAVSLAPLNFEDAIRAAMATGKPPKAKRPKASKKSDAKRL
jgi:hypothetical protein